MREGHHRRGVSGRCPRPGSEAALTAPLRSAHQRSPWLPTALAFRRRSPAGADTRARRRSPTGRGRPSHGRRRCRRSARAHDGQRRSVRAQPVPGAWWTGLLTAERQVLARSLAGLPGGVPLFRSCSTADAARHLQVGPQPTHCLPRGVPRRALPARRSPPCRQRFGSHRASVREVVAPHGLPSSVPQARYCRPISGSNLANRNSYRSNQLASITL